MRKEGCPHHQQHTPSTTTHPTNNNTGQKLEKALSSTSANAGMGRFVVADTKNKDDRPLNKVCQDAKHLAVEQIKGLSSQVWCIWVYVDVYVSVVIWGTCGCVYLQHYIYTLYIHYIYTLYMHYIYTIYTLYIHSSIVHAQVVKSLLFNHPLGHSCAPCAPEPESMAL